jgi:hypothetical protein
MKKFAKILAAVMLVAIVAMTFASCGLFGLDLEKVEDRLEDKDYKVYYVDDLENTDDMGFEELGALMSISFMFEEFGIDETPVAGLMGSSEDDEENAFFAAEFESASDASDAYDSLKDAWDEYTEDADDDVKVTYGKSGKVVYFGTVQGVKDALGFPSNLLVFKK